MRKRTITFYTLVTDCECQTETAECESAKEAIEEALLYGCQKWGNNYLCRECYEKQNVTSKKLF